MSTTKIKTLELEHDNRSRGAPYCSIEFAERARTPLGAYLGVDNQPYRVTIWNDGFEATRELNHDEIEAIRDWCNEALAEHPND